MASQISIEVGTKGLVITPNWQFSVEIRKFKIFPSFTDTDLLQIPSPTSTDPVPMSGSQVVFNGELVEADHSIAKQMAIEILQGRDDVAYPLADDVLMSRTTPDWFVPRWRLLQQIEALKTENERLRRQNFLEGIGL